MRKVDGLRISTLLLLLCILGACSTKTTIKENDLSFSDYQIDTVSHLFNDTTKPACHFELNMNYPSVAQNEEQLTKIQKLFVTDYFGEKYESKSPVEAANAYMKEYLENYRQLEEDYATFSKDEEGVISTAWMNYQESSNSKILYNRDHFLSYAITLYTYTGGAHGMQSQMNHVIDLNNVYPLSLSDIFNENNLNNIATLIIKQIAKDRGYENPAQLNEDGFFSIEEVQPTDNFLIDESGMTWVYNPYEIAVYAAGPITVSVEWEELKPYIREDSSVLRLADESFS
ncbi:MAG: DUF3298 domain-containing protein [Bacteroidales bacterium]